VGPLAFSPDSSELVYIVLKNKVRNGYELVYQFLDSEKGQKTHSVTQDVFVKGGDFNSSYTSITALAISSDNQLLVTGDEHGIITLIDIMNQKVIHSWPAHSEQIAHLLFSPDGKMLASEGRDGFTKVWGIYP
jgi:WD40 repeat protein